MQYLYYLANASRTMRVVEYLKNDSSVEFVTVINQLHGWIVNVKIKSFVPIETNKDIRAFLNEMGIVYSPSNDILSKVISSLEAGEPVIKVMQTYKMMIVSHGRPQPDEIKIFQQHLICKLGYRPQNLA